MTTSDLTISVVTPSYNQGPFIQRTIESVLAQTGDFTVEHIIMDGGSSDTTADVVAPYRDRLTWIREPDNGQSHAINKGFRRASGQIIAWLNSDDTYAAGALQRVADAYRQQPFDWCFGDCYNIDEHDREIRQAITRYKQSEARRYSLRRLLRRDFIAQPATFFTRAAYERTGPVAEDLCYSMDYDYWLRLGRQADPVYIPAFLASFRWHGSSKNGALYRKAAWETYQTARRHARPEERAELAMHFLHVIALTALYPFL